MRAVTTPCRVGHPSRSSNPNLPIVDPHHHLWFRPEAFLQALEQEDNLTAQALSGTFRRHARYLFDEFLADLNSGHNIRATVYVEVGSMYRTNGPEEMRSVGEVEFANGMAAMAASGVFPDIAICGAIVGSVDLRMGDAAEDVLLSHIEGGGERYRGIRAKSVVHDDDPTVLGPAFNGAPHLHLLSDFRTGFRHLAPLGLSYDASHEKTALFSGTAARIYRLPFWMPRGCMAARNDGVKPCPNESRAKTQTACAP